jgi:hypothetical protein
MNTFTAIFDGEIPSYVESDFNAWLKDHKEATILNVQYQRTNERLSIFILYQFTDEALRNFKEKHNLY